MTDSNFALTLIIQRQEFKVSEFIAYETISRNFYARLILLLENIWENPHTLIKQNVSFKMLIKEQYRFFNGFIYRVNYSALPNQEGFYELRLLVVSWLTLFKESCEYHLFEHKTALEIITELFKHNPWCRLDASKLSKQPDQHAYQVQYQESRYQFVQRLLDEAGFNYYYQHQPQSHHLVLIDQLNTDIKELDENFFWQWQSYETLIDPYKRFTFKSTHLDMPLGSCFSYKHQSYQILQIKHFAQDFSHMNRSTKLNNSTQTYYNHCCVMSGNEFYKKHPRAKLPIKGIQRATVTDLKSNGLSLSYSWSTQKTQHEVPSLQALSDDKQNLSFPPLVGMEVLVGYQDADIEKPLIIAASYNASCTPPFAYQPWVNGLKAPNLKSAQLQTELSFDTSPQAEQILLTVAGDFRLEVQGGLNYHIKGNYSQKAQGESKLQAKSILVQAKELSLQAGPSLIKISPQEIRIEAKSIHLN